MTFWSHSLCPVNKGLSLTVFAQEAINYRRTDDGGHTNVAIAIAAFAGRFNMKLEPRRLQSDRCIDGEKLCLTANHVSRRETTWLTTHLVEDVRPRNFFQQSVGDSDVRFFRVEGGSGRRANDFCAEGPQYVDLDHTCTWRRDGHNGHSAGLVVSIPCSSSGRDIPSESECNFNW